MISHNYGILFLIAASENSKFKLINLKNIYIIKWYFLTLHIIISAFYNNNNSQWGEYQWFLNHSVVINWEFINDWTKVIGFCFIFCYFIVSNDRCTRFTIFSIYTSLLLNHCCYPFNQYNNYSFSYYFYNYYNCYIYCGTYVIKCC